MDDQPADALPGVPPVESPLFASIFNAESCDAGTLRLAQQLNAHGFAIVRFPEHDLAAIAEAVSTELLAAYPQDVVEDGWMQSPALRRLALNPHILSLLTRLYGRPAFAFSTVTRKVLPEQPLTSDAVRLATTPPRYLCGVFVALQDVTPATGAFTYVGGSHRWPIFGPAEAGVDAAVASDADPVLEHVWRTVAEASGAPRETLVIKQGAAIIFTANLLHGMQAGVGPATSFTSNLTYYSFHGCGHYDGRVWRPEREGLRWRTVTDMETGGVIHPPTPLTPVVLPADFDPAAYLAANPDVAQSGFGAEAHYLRFGHFEGRPTR